MIKAGNVIGTYFYTHDPATGLLRDADSLPTGVYGAGSGGGSCTVSNVGTGEYLVYFTAPSASGTLAHGDPVTITVSATVNGVTDKRCVLQDTFDTRLDAAVSSRATPSDVTSIVPTAGAVADAVWDEAQSDHMTGSTFGGQISETHETVQDTFAEVGSDDGSGTIARGVWAKDFGTEDAEDTVVSIYNRVLGLTAGAISVISPVIPSSGAASMVRGDSYDIGFNPLSFNYTGTLDLTGATLKFKYRQPGAVTTPDEKTMTVSGSVNNYTLTVGFTTSETAALTADSYQFDIECTLASGKVVTFVRLGTLTMLSDLR